MLRKTQRGVRVRASVVDRRLRRVDVRRKKGEEGKEDGATGESGTSRKKGRRRGKEGGETGALKLVFVEKGWFQKKPGVNEMGRRRPPLVLISGGAAARARG